MEPLVGGGEAEPSEFSAARWMVEVSWVTAAAPEFLGWICEGAGAGPWPAAAADELCVGVPAVEA